MKRIVFCLGLLLLFSCEKEASEKSAACNFTALTQEKDFQTDIGTMAEDMLLFGSQKKNSTGDISSFIQSRKYLPQGTTFLIREVGSLSPYTVVILKLGQKYNCSELTGIMNELKKSNLVEYVHYAAYTENSFAPGDHYLLEVNPTGDRYGKGYFINSYMENFQVKLKEASDLPALESLVKDTKCRIAPEFNPQTGWYTIVADKHAQGDAIQMSNLFHETGKFEWVRTMVVSIVLPLE